VKPRGGRPGQLQEALAEGIGPLGPRVLEIVHIIPVRKPVFVRVNVFKVSLVSVSCLSSFGCVFFFMRITPAFIGEPTGAGSFALERPARGEDVKE
jgi:hypothetical protein